MVKTAFVVEDEENIREIIKCAVESCGLSVVGFDDAVGMFERLGSLGRPKAETPRQENALPSIILLDIMLPRMDGMEALRRLKAETLTAEIPVILLTAKSSETDKVSGLDAGADDYITKPFGVLELMARVRAALRHMPVSAARSDVCSHNGLTLDNARHEVTLNGEPVELTLKEFELLKILMENMGCVMPRDTLLDRIWGYGYAGETRTLDMHIRSLRQKLHDDAGGSGFISTVRGVGYKFNV
jgi:two-component system alkaline phosphatase synthesis response regulator PhoP